MGLLVFNHKVATGHHYKVLVADMHLHHLPVWRFEWCVELIQSLLELNCTLGESDLVLLGDVFELRNRVDCRIANLFIKLVLEWEGEVFWVVGQHDSYIPGTATFSALNGVNGITVIDSGAYCEPDTNNWYIPYFRNQAEYLEVLNTVPDGAQVFTHMPIAEALIGKGDAPSEQIRAREFKRFGRVWAGDIHVANKYGKVEYVGAPGQRDWRDDGVKGRIILLGGVKVTSRSIPVRVRHPRHIKLTSMVAIRRFIGDEDGCIVKVAIPEIPSQECLDLLRKKQGVMEVEVEIPLAPIGRVVEKDTDLVKSNDELLLECLEEHGSFLGDLKTLALEEGKAIMAKVE